VFEKAFLQSATSQFAEGLFQTRSKENSSSIHLFIIY